MLKLLRNLGVALAATLFMTATASAAPVIDFDKGPAGHGGAIVDVGGGHLMGTGIPIGEVSFRNTPFHDGSFFNVFGSVNNSSRPGNFGALNFDTRTGLITLDGCIPGLGMGDANCANPFRLLEGNITSFENLGGFGIFIRSGTDIKHVQLLTAVGLDPSLPFEMGPGGSFTDGGTTAISTDIVNTQVPEPATMILLGTGLLAAFRARRRQAR